MDRSQKVQMILATHSRELTAYPAACMQLTRSSLAPLRLKDVDHFRTLREFWADLHGFVEASLWA